MTTFLNPNEFFSIEHFDDNGIEQVALFTGLETEYLHYEQTIGNHLIGKATKRNKYYAFCQADTPETEITFNAFKARHPQNIGLGGH